MNIAVFTETFLPNVDGVVVSICNMNRLLVRRGHNVSVFTVGKGPEQVDGYRIFRTRGLSIPSYKAYKLGLPSLSIMETVAKNRTEILHSRGPFTMGLMAKHISKLMGLPLIGTFDTPIHEYVHYLPLAGRFRVSKDALIKLAIKYSMWYYNRCDLVTAPSETIKRELRRLGYRKRIEVLSNGVDIKRYGPGNCSESLRRKFCKPDEKMILHVGRIITEKGIDVLMRAAREMKKKCMKFKLVVVGRGPGLEDLKKMCSEMGLSERVVFTGFVPDDELPKYYATADLFATASTVETQGIVMLESMASGTPVVGADAGAIPELIKNGKNGLTFRAGDYGEMADSIMDILEDLEDDALRKRMSRCARASVMEHSLERVCDSLEGIYEEMIRIKK